MDGLDLDAAEMIEDAMSLTPPQEALLALLTKTKVDPDFRYYRPELIADMKRAGFSENDAALAIATCQTQGSIVRAPKLTDGSPDWFRLAPVKAH